MNFSFKTTANHLRKLPFVLTYLAAIIFVVSWFIGLKDPFYGYTWLPQFGSAFHAQKSERLKETNHLFTSNYGYDGQFYAQLALDPLLADASTVEAMDTPVFRLRRVLFSATAYIAGGGDPQRSLQAYSFQNIVFWLIIAGLLLYWLPPTNWQNTLRYVALLLTSGLVTTLSRSLLDGPAMALVLLGVLLCERRRDNASALVLALAGLGKETSIFAAAGLRLPVSRHIRSILPWALRLAFVAAPLLLWCVYIQAQVGTRANGAAGSGAFDWPLFGWASAGGQLLDELAVEGWLPFNYLSALFLIALPVQAVCILARPDIENVWWRVGAVYAAFTLILGPAVWAGVTVATARVALPLTFAFNLLHPRSLPWLPLLILGNALTFIGVHDILHTHPPKFEMHLGVNFQSRLPMNGLPMPVFAFGEGWYGEERDSDRVWRWSRGDSELIFDNPTSESAVATIGFSLRTLAPRSVTISVNGDFLASYDCPKSSRQQIEIEVPITPGRNRIRFHSPEPPSQALPDIRDLAFTIEDYRFRVD